MNLGLQPRHFLREGVGHPAERVAVHQNSGHFHLGKDGDERALQSLVNRGDMAAMQLRLEQLPQAQCDIGIFGGVFHGLLYGDLVEGDSRFAAAQKLFDRDRGMAEVTV